MAKSEIVYVVIHEAKVFGVCLLLASLIVLWAK